jgi:hypothetical protein
VAVPRPKRNSLVLVSNVVRRVIVLMSVRRMKRWSRLLRQDKSFRRVVTDLLRGD